MSDAAEKIEDQEPQATLGDALRAAFDEQAASESVEESAEPEAGEADVEAEAPQEAEVSAEPEVVPPEHWSDEDKQAFMQMDESGREWALRLEANAHKGIEEKATELKQYRDAFEPYKHLIPAGVSESQVIQQLLNAQAILQKNPVEGVKWLMRSYGVDEKQLMPSETPVADDDLYVDPQVKALQEKIELMQKQAEDRQSEAEQRRQNALYAEVQKFQNEVDDAGQLKHPHFQAVQGVMAGLINSGRAEDLEDAYAQAIWSVPEYREQELARQAKERAEAELQKKREAAEAAEKASKSVKGKTSAKAPTKPATIADDLAANYEKSIRGEL